MTLIDKFLRAFWMTRKSTRLTQTTLFFFVCVCVTNKMESLTVDLLFDGYVKLGQFNTIILDLIRRVCCFSLSFETRCRKGIFNEGACFWLRRARSRLFVILLLFIKHREGCRFIYIFNWRIEVLKWQVLNPLQLFISVFRCFSFIFYIRLFLNFKDKIEL